jgi:hypothetical protein
MQPGETSMLRANSATFAASARYSVSGNRNLFCLKMFLHVLRLSTLNIHG